MTSVYVLRSVPDLYASLALDDSDVMYLEQLRDSFEVRDWSPPKAHVVPSPSGSSDLPDHPYLLANLPCFSDKAAHELRPFLEGNGRLWPIETPAGNFHAFQVTSIIPALDLDASTFLRYPDGSIFLITGHVFRNTQTASASIFRLPYKRASATYVTQALVDAVEDAQLTGFSFSRVWDGIRPVTADHGW